MTKEEIKRFSGIVKKYSYAIGAVLYPSQVELLQKSVEDYVYNDEIPDIKDSFVRLAFLMIMCDLIDTEEGEKDDC